MALALDGVSNAIYGGFASGGTLTLSTTNANDVIIFALLSNSGSAVSVTSPSLTWTKRATGGTGVIVDEWYAVASSPLSSEVITFTVLIAFISAVAFGISGANSSAPFDVNGTLPFAASAAPVTLSTTASDTFILGIFRHSGDSNPGPGTGFTEIAGGSGGAGYFEVQYKIVSSPQTNLVFTDNDNNDVNGCIGDAVQIGNASSQTIFRRTLSSLGTRAGSRQLQDA